MVSETGVLCVEPPPPPPPVFIAVEPQLVRSENANAEPNRQNMAFLIIVLPGVRIRINLDAHGESLRFLVNSKRTFSQGCRSKFPPAMHLGGRR
jgi:hypothetical protein